MLKLTYEPTYYPNTPEGLLRAEATLRVAAETAEPGETFDLHARECPVRGTRWVVRFFEKGEYVMDV